MVRYLREWMLILMFWVSMASEIFTSGLDVGCGDVVLYLLNRSTCLEGLNYNLQNLLLSTAAKGSISSPIMFPMY